MSGKLILSACFALLLQADSNCQGAQGDTPAGLEDAAQSGLVRFTSQMPANALQGIGLPDSNAMTRATLGKPLQVYQMPPARLEKSSANDTVDTVTTPTTLWYFPVLVDNVAKAILVVDLVNSQWKAVSLGHLALATELKSIQEQWPEIKGYHPKLIMANQVKQCFFTVPEIDRTNLTEIKLRKSALQPSTGTKYDRLGKFADHAQTLKKNYSDAIKANPGNHYRTTGRQD